MATFPLLTNTTLISLHLWWFATHQRRIIISIYHSIDIWEEFSTTGVFSTENRSAYRRRWENYRWCDALIWIKFKSPIRADEPRLLRRIYVNIYQWARGLYAHAHPHKMKSPSASCSLPSKCTTTQYHATINFVRERIMPQSITCKNQLGQNNQCLYSCHTYLYVWTQLFTYHAYMHKWRLNEMTRQSTLMVWEGIWYENGYDNQLW